MRHTRWDTRGFTLLEILVVIGIIALLATLVIAAINPARQFAQARNTQRLSGITAILGGIGQRIVDNRGVFEGGGCPALTTATTSIGSALSSCLTPTYLAMMPRDPAAPVGEETGYELRLHAETGRVTVCAPLAAGESSLGAEAYVPCVTR